MTMQTKHYLAAGAAALAFTGAYAQSPMDAMALSQQDMRGTARYMSMGGAFGALGGDLTTLSQNPAGIGVYRGNEMGLTLDLDMHGAESTSVGGTQGVNKTHFFLNNIGGVLTLRLPSTACPNLNFGFTYSKGASFNRNYRGPLGALQTSMSNWMAGVANNEGVTVGDVTTTNTYDPYNPVSGYQAPWMTILAYDSYLITPEGDPDSPTWYGQFDSGTSGNAIYNVSESGGVDNFNIAFGGNINNILYWGMDFDIASISYRRSTYYEETLQNAYVEGTNGVEQVASQWGLSDYYRMSGTGFSYKLGFILKPIQEFRIGFAFHTPTYYNLSQEFSANTLYSYNGEGVKGQETNGIPGYSDLRFHTPWKIQVSAAAVIGSNFILSGEYQWSQTSKMKFNDPTYYTGYYDYGWDWYGLGDNDYYGDYGNSYRGVNQAINMYYKDQNTFRIGAEFRVTPQFSVRAGYANVSSPVKAELKNGNINVMTSGTSAGYRLDDATNYITAGLGYRTGKFYADLAYVYKHQKSTYHAFPQDAGSSVMSPAASLSFEQNQVLLSLGFKF